MWDDQMKDAMDNGLEDAKLSGAEEELVMAKRNVMLEKGKGVIVDTNDATQKGIELDAVFDGNFENIDGSLFDIDGN